MAESPVRAGTREVREDLREMEERSVGAGLVIRGGGGCGAFDTWGPVVCGDRVGLVRADDACAIVAAVKALERISVNEIPETSDSREDFDDIAEGFLRTGSGR
jgi:hypothetical protein